MLFLFQYSIEHHHLDYRIIYNGYCIGSVHVSFKNDIYEKNCEIDYWLAYEYWGLGIMNFVIELLCHFLFHHYPIYKIYAEVFADNKASIRIFEKIIFNKKDI